MTTSAGGCEVNCTALGWDEDGTVCTGDGIERYSCGAYAGRYCDRHWAASGYRDASDRIDPTYCGEVLEPEHDSLGSERDW